MTLFTAIAALAAIDLAAGAFDAYETLVGIEKGVGVEGNSVINWLARSPATQKPAAWAIITFNVVRTALYAAIYFTHNVALEGGAAGALVASIAGHIQAAFKWRYLIGGGKIDPTKSYSWWQKLLGMGWN